MAGTCLPQDADEHLNGHAAYQLLFERTIPGFRPSPEAYAPAVRALDTTRAVLARNEVTDPRDLDLWTALTTGVVSQQISNDPGGDRWTRLAADAVSMFLDHCQQTNPVLEARR